MCHARSNYNFSSVEIDIATYDYVANVADLLHMMHRVSVKDHLYSFEDK